MKLSVVKCSLKIGRKNGRSLVKGMCQTTNCVNVGVGMRVSDKEEQVKSLDWACG